MGEMYDLLKEGLSEALEHARCQKTLRTKTIYLPDPAKRYNAEDVKTLRLKLGFSQKTLAL